MLRLSRRVWTQLAILAVITVVAVGVMAFGFVKVPALLGIGRYTVTVELPASGGLYPTSVVNYRGSEVGSVKSIDVTHDGVRAVLTLDSAVAIPSNVSAAVHSRSAVGEQFIELTPATGRGRHTARSCGTATSSPSAGPRFPSTSDALLDATNKALQAIPQDNLRTVVDEAATAVAGLGPELSRIVDGSTALAIEGGKTIDPLGQIDRPVPARAQFPSADGGFDRNLGAADGLDHRSAQGAGCRVRGSAQRRWSGAGGRQSAVRPGRPRLAGAAGQSGESRRHRGHLPQRSSSSCWFSSRRGPQ